MRKGIAFTAVIAAAGVMPVQAQAQASEASSGEESEIIVTATRRPLREIELPSSISTVSGEDLERSGVRQVMDLGSTVTGLQLAKVGGSTIPSIRGVSTEAAGIGSDGNVAIYVDGVYQPLTQGNDFRFMDLERVEVLKGPQGTLYGRNATGGAILFVTREPSLTETSGEIIASYGSFDDRSVRARLSTPITDTLAVSVSGSIGKSDGYTKDLVRGGKSNPTRTRQVRGKLFWQPSDDLKATLTGEYAYVYDPTSFAGLALAGNTLGAAYGADPVATEPHTSSMDVEVFSKVKRLGGSLKLEGDLGFGTLTSTTAYFEYDIPFAVDADYSPLPLAAYFSDFNHTSAFQQELVLASQGASPFNWLVGASYHYMQTKSQIDIPYAGLLLVSLNTLKTEAASAFAEASYEILPGLTTTAGARFSTEKQALFATRGFGLPSSEPQPLRGKKSWNDVTPSVSLRYAVNDRTNIYASYSQGFKSGVFDGSLYVPLEQESIDAYEIGIKSQSIRNLRASLAGFYYTYKNQQVQSFVVIGGTPQGILQNAGKSEIYGLDAELEARLTPEFRLSAGLSLLHARFESFPAAIINVPAPGGGNTSEVIDARGNALPRSPDWTLSVQAEYRRDTPVGEVTLQGTLFHSDKLYYEYANRVVQPAYTKIDVNLSLDVADSGFRVTVFGKNITDKNYIASTFITQTVDGVTYAPPRQIGIEVGYSF